jgi:rod shape determining protein RodA
MTAASTAFEIKPREAKATSIDFVLLITTVALAALGLLMIFTVTAPRLESIGVPRSQDMVRQSIFAGVALVVLVVATSISDRMWKLLAPYAYGGAIVLLILAMTPLGGIRQGAQRWIPLGIFDLQPSEFAKPAVILVLALLLSSVEENRMPWLRIAQAMGLVALPSVLIFLQPDLGTMLVFGFVLVAMLFVAGTTLRQLTLLLIGGVIALIALFQLDLLKEYQLDRLAGFLNAGQETLTVNYNQTQSQVAIGAGGLFGRGLFEGTQTNLAFVPAQRTDFVFTAVGEQMGFAGGALVLGLYALLVWRMLLIAAVARDRFGQLVAAGAAAMVGFHVFVNVGMTVGLLPVTGLPLPFMSYGGSFLGAMAMTVGIVHSIYLRRSRSPGERRARRARAAA